MENNYVIGKVWNELEKEFIPVVGEELRNTLGFYQFYQVAGSDNFRKRPNAEQGDEIASISFETFVKFESI